MNIEDAKAIPPGQKLLLVTVTPIETQAVSACFDPDGNGSKVEGARQPFRWLGKRGHFHLFTVTSPGMGAQVSQNLASGAFDALDPGLLVAVGIAFGAGKPGQKVGDVLVADFVQGYDIARLEPDLATTYRQKPVQASTMLVGQFVDLRQHGRPRQWSGAWPELHIGTLLSGGKLIDNIDYRNSLLKQWPDAIGGEMEAIGIASAAEFSSKKREWTIVKGICDWADGHKHTADKDLHQRVAAWNAALCVRAMIEPEALGTLTQPGEVRDFIATSPPSLAPSQAAAAPMASVTTPRRAPPSAASVASRAATVAQLSEAVSRLFQRPQLKGQSFIAMDGAVPECLLAALKQVDPVARGECVVEAVVDIAESLLKAVASEELSVPVSARPAIREAMFEAIGMAAKLGVDLDLVPGTVDGDTFLVVPAELPEGATLGLRKTPHKCWAWSLTDGLPRLRDQQIERVPIEMGEGQPRIDAMTRLAYRSVSVGGFVPAEISPQGLMWLRAVLNNLRKQGRTQCFFLGDESVASQDLRDWAQRMRTCLIVLRPADNVTMFLLDEVLLVGRVRHFIGLFNDKDWPT